MIIIYTKKYQCLQILDSINESYTRRVNYGAIHSIVQYNKAYIYVKTTTILKYSAKTTSTARHAIKKT